MATVSFPFDGSLLEFDVDDSHLAEILSPKPSTVLPDLDRAIGNALDNPINQQPLESWVKEGDQVIIVSDDNTRLTPADRILPQVLDRLNSAGVPDSSVGCIMALGTHRYMSEQEMEAKVGSQVYQRIRVINHEWRDPGALVDLGRSSQGTPLTVNRLVAKADVVIGLGAIVPHHIPGYSGSSKIIQPGVSGAETTAETHLLSCKSGGDSFLGIEDNPVRRDMDDMADMVGMNTIFNVVMDSQGGVVGVFYGEKRATFARGVELARDIYGVSYNETPDIVIANSYPCDLDFWQSHKSLYPAQRMVRPGGTIIVCTPAPEGVSPVHTDLLNYTSWSSLEIKDGYRDGRIKNGVAAALAAAWSMVREKASIIMYSPGIPPEDKARLGHSHAGSIEEAIAEAVKRQGANARLTVLTHAPDMLPISAVQAD
jgi:nickel-dependent lactate racemase